jgi:pimeloyl-ACP methyl ester carboxylesterase
LATLATKFHWDARAAERETRMLNAEKIIEKLPAFAQTLQQRHYPKDWKMVLTHTAALLKDLGDNPPLSPATCHTINIPVLLLLGDNDKMVSVEETQAIYKSIPGAQLEMLPATPHPIEQVDVVILREKLRRFYQE